MADLREDFWDNLLDYIQDRAVIPVIGPELVTVRDGERDLPLYQWIAQRLAADLKLPIAELPEDFGPTTSFPCTCAGEESARSSTPRSTECCATPR